jgi:hypothetical protein
MNTTQTKMVPLVSSGTSGPLGAAHLPRLWLKLTLGANGMLSEEYDECGNGFDQMTLSALGLDKGETMAFVRDEHPTYMQFEEYVLAKNGGTVAPEKLAAHNAAIAGYHHSDELAGTMRSASSIKHEGIKDAVTLNTVEDLDEIHKQVSAKR